MAKAAASAADAVCLDLEDSVTPDEKPASRTHVIKALRGLDFGGRMRLTHRRWGHGIRQSAHANLRHDGPASPVWDGKRSALRVLCCVLLWSWAGSLSARRVAMLCRSYINSTKTSLNGP